jgi:transcriptional regulator with XRE-family HTH domain
MGTIGAMLLRERLARGLTQEEAAMQVGVGQSTWARYETGKQFPATDKVLTLAAWLGADPVALLHVITDEVQRAPQSAQEEHARGLLAESQRARSRRRPRGN